MRMTSRLRDNYQYNCMLHVEDNGCDIADWQSVPADGSPERKKAAEAERGKAAQSVCKC